jgi:hypothetical protein
MPTTTMVVTSQVMEIDEISDVAVTAIAHDDEAGDFYRDLIFFGTPPEMAAGTTVVDVSTIPTILKLRIRAPTVEPLKITVPQDEF